MQTGVLDTSAIESQLGKRIRPLRTLAESVWICLYLFLIVFPLLILIVGQIPRGGGFWWDFSMGLGFTGLAIMGLQFVLTARFRGATAPFGIDIIYFFHRWVAIVGIVLVLGHYVILRTKYGTVLPPLSPAQAPWHMTAGRLAVIIFLGLIVTSMWRKQLKIEYDRWRFWHGVLALVAVGLAILHISGVSYYTEALPRKILWTTYSAMWVLALLYIRLVRPIYLLRKPYHVRSVRQERGDSWTVTVEPTGQHTLKFHPGQFAWLTIGGSPLRAKEHPFSFSGSAENAKTLQFTIKELGDFTRTIRDLKNGDVAYVDGPHGVFTPDLYPDAPGFGFIAGGVGIAPMMSMLRTLADRGDKRPLHLIYGSASWEQVISREEIESLKVTLNLRVVHVLNDPPPGWTGATGILTDAVLRESLSPESSQFVFFVCGPKGMTQSALRTLRSLGVPLWRVHSEHFDMA